VSTRAPARTRILVLVAFTASCVGLLVYLWVSFGGSVPLAPQGYRFSVEFDQAVQLGTQADVEISGVTIGKVQSVGLDRRTGLTRAVIQIDPRYAPRPANTRAMLRAKTLLGETYVQLSAGDPTGPKLPDGGRLAQAQVAPTVQLDQILNTFKPATRRAFETWMQDGGMALTGRGQAVNAALAELFPFTTNADAVLKVLDRDRAATSALLSNGSRVLAAVDKNPAALQGLIRNADALFAATASRDSDLASSVRDLPAFLRSTRQTVARLDRFARQALPLVNELKPAAAKLRPALKSLSTFAPKLKAVLAALMPLTAASRVGVPALESFLDRARPLLRRAGPYLGELIPVIRYVGKYRRELAAFFANLTASTQAEGKSISTSAILHYVRAQVNVSPQSLAAYPKRPSDSRSNPYMAPGGLKNLLRGLEVFGRYLCTNNALPTIGSSIPSSLASVLSSVYYTDEPGGPACKAQGPLGLTTTGLSKTFPDLKALAK
jgi:virulence factor Mce-like protein